MLRSITLPATLTSKFFVVITFVLFGLLASCSPQDSAIVPLDEANTGARANAVPALTSLDSNSTLKAIARFPIGAAPASWLPKKSPKGFKVLEEQFNAKTVHTYMNQEVSQGKFDFTESDYWVKWAESRSVRLHGHCLVYQGAAPDWILNFKGTNSEFEQVIKNHIQTVVGRYKGKIKSWDVVNELINDKDGSMFMRTFRKRYASDKEYIEFVKLCFQWAHEADPNALLFYNDYNFEVSPAKVEGIIRLVNEFKRTGTPIHGIGSQMHISINTPDAGIRSSLQRLATTGLQIHVSELDVRLNPDNLNTSLTSQALEAQQAKFQSVARAYNELVPRHQQYGITVWDLSDADSWIVMLLKQNDAPSMFNTSYDKKPAFYGLMQGLK